MIGLNEDASAPPEASPKPTQLRKLVAGIFAETGQLCEALKLEHRPEQPGPG